MASVLLKHWSMKLICKDNRHESAEYVVHFSYNYAAAGCKYAKVLIPLPNMILFDKEQGKYGKHTFSTWFSQTVTQTLSSNKKLKVI